MRMENFVKNIKQDIEVEIKRIEQQDIDILDKIKQIVGFIQTSLARLKAAVADYQFINPEEEILFFKVRKPQISGLLIFYIRLYQIEKNRIGKSPSAQYKYLKEEYGFAYHSSLFSMKPILKASEIDDSRPTVVRVMNEAPKLVSVLSGKINTVYDLDEVLEV